MNAFFVSGIKKAAIFLSQLSDQRSQSTTFLTLHKLNVKVQFNFV